MPGRDPFPFLPIPDSLGALQTDAGGSFSWHTHLFDELCLVDKTPTTIGHAGKQYPAAPGTLFLFRRGESHGYLNSLQQRTRLWVIHYHSDAALDAAVPGLISGDATRRIWRLSPERIETFQAFHTKITIERALARAGSEAAQSAWLRLLLVAVGRWGDDASADDLSPQFADAELLKLWRIIRDYTGKPAGLAERLKSQIVNYDSLRHRFRKLTGESPTRMWSRLRLHQARSLLAESSLSVKEIAARVGFGRQHEFARAFRQQFGISPTDWRNGAFHGGDKSFHGR